jgi:hypothetical protein
MGWATYWVIFLQTHLVTLHAVITQLILACSMCKEIVDAVLGLAIQNRTKIVIICTYIILTPRCMLSHNNIFFLIYYLHMYTHTTPALVLQQCARLLGLYTTMTTTTTTTTTTIPFHTLFRRSGFWNLHWTAAAASSSTTPTSTSKQGAQSFLSSEAQT